MLYFVNQYLMANNSSIEHAEIKRLHLFQKLGHADDARLVLRDFLPKLDQNLKRFNLDRSQVIDMYDFFAYTTAYVGKRCHVNDLHLSHEYQITSGNNYREAFDGSRLVARINFIGGEVALVDNVEFYDDAGNITLREVYDYRGFKAVSEYFGQDGAKFLEEYHRPDGSVYLERYYVKSTKNTPINSRNILKDYQGHEWTFDNEEELFTFFLDELNRQHGENNQFVADRPAAAIDPILAMKSQAQRYLYLPMREVDDGLNYKTGPLNEMLQAALLTNNGRHWQGIIVSTQAQKKMLEKRLKNHAPITVINQTPQYQVENPVSMDKRQRHQLLYVGRLGDDKQIDHLLKIFQLVHQHDQQASLKIYGYGNSDDVQRYQQLQKQLGLEQAVEFAGYQPDLDEVYNQAGLFVDSSRMDSQPLAMAEALNHGLPVVSFNYPYGPREMVKNDVNGYLVPLVDDEKFAARVLQILENPDLQDRLSQAAYERVDGLKAQTTMDEWQTIM